MLSISGFSWWNVKTQGMQWITPKQTPTKSTIMTTVMLASSSVLLAQNLGTQFSQLKLTFSSWPAIISLNIFSSHYWLPSKSISTSLRLVLTWGCVSFSSDFWKTWTGWLILRGLLQQKIYTTKFMVAYASITISRWVTGRCLMAHAIHCITNHDVWSRMRDLASQLLFPLSLISAFIGMMNDLA